MKIIPAIDVKDGRCVRLRQGRAQDATVYGEDPVQMALRWQRDGADFLHIVDLDGAFQGHPAILDICRRIKREVGIGFEVGGGLRSDGDVSNAIDAGASRVILGSRAVSDPKAAEALVMRFGADKIVAGIDARDGFVQVAGWTQTTRVRAVDLAVDLAGRGFRIFAFTDTATDGMLSGPNVSAMAEMADAIAPFGAHLVASGGVSSPSDISRLAAAGKDNICAVIVGKALYEGAAPLSAFIAAASGKIFGERR